MHFVQNDNLSCQPEGAHKSVLHIHGCHQRLVDGPHSERCQQTPFTLIKPGSARSSLLAHVGLKQPGIGMQQQGAVGAIICKHFAKKILEAIKNLVRCQLGRQRKVDTAGLTGRQQLIGGI